MQIKQVTYKKERKIGLPNYSNVTIEMSMIVDWGEDGKIEHNFAWDQIDAELDTQTEIEKSRFAIFSSDAHRKQPAATDPKWITEADKKPEKPSALQMLKKGTPEADKGKIFKPGS